ncbi:MAG: hypothetical protein A2X81_17130 [Desulfobacterales bacterium GWB2_56_26]|nr:MAG: hypothetical protein A2X81_17130 [Desulfobacterales bacterium GWB2_56_26]
MFIKMKNLIPTDRMRNADDLYRKWQEIRAGESKAVIIDLRTEVVRQWPHSRLYPYKFRPCLHYSRQMG